jgi:CDGSH-type Zn-finger protein
MAKFRLIAAKDGPILVEVNGEVKAALCRCGHSANKPYCDGSHTRVGFKAEEKVAFRYEES